MPYNHTKIEKKWQSNWDKTKQKTITDITRKKYYVLEMFPYPSGRIHMGHVRNYTLGDVVARFKKMQGYNVLHPMGWDAFGLPAENAAIAMNVHPKSWTYENIAAMKKQLQPLGFDYDWDRELATCDSEYYKHEQSMFINFLNAGLVYQKESVVNWDPVDCTVLANEQVENGRGWRSGAIVEKKKLKQWFLAITEFADELLESLETLKGWPDNVKLMQHNWIGKSYGAKIKFKVENTQDEIVIYSTRPDTLFGASFIAIAPDHPFAAKCTEQDIKNFVAECAKNSVAESTMETMEKKGIATGFHAIHPITNQQIPIYIANFVLMEYGTGAIFGCPGHDIRDHEFALKYNLPVMQVVEGGSIPYTEDGLLINSDFLNGLNTTSAKERMIEYLEQHDIGTRHTQYRLRDWGVSRQRYWGCPIPIIHCKKCGPVAVPKSQLPVTLPDDIDLQIPGNPLANHPTWRHVNCPKCNEKAERETDTLDTFFESSWYFFRYCSASAENPLNMEEIRYWMPVDQYIGGIEHAVMHLLYARFFTKALARCGYEHNISEPFTNLMTQGMICHETYKDTAGKWLYPEEVEKKADGKYVVKASGQPAILGRIEKMSKSKKNTVDPDIMLEKYGADAVRFFLLSDSPPDRNLEWSDAGIENIHKYLNKLYMEVEKLQGLGIASIQDLTQEDLYVIHSTIYNVTNDIEIFHFNKAIARIREMTNYFCTESKNSTSKVYAFQVIIKLLYPFTPHLSEEFWSMLFPASILTDMEWPASDPQYMKRDVIHLPVQINGKMRGTVDVEHDMTEQKIMDIVHSSSIGQKYLQDTQIVKIIYVQNKIINLICK